MNQRPKSRVDGVDGFMVQRAAEQILKEMAENGWNQGEAELLPRYLEGAIKKNSDRIRKLEPFAVCEVTAQEPL